MFWTIMLKLKKDEMSRKGSFSGIQPSENLHLGNYIGVIKQ